MPPTFQKNLLVITFEKTLETFLYVLKKLYYPVHDFNVTRRLTAEVTLRAPFDFDSNTH